MSLKSESLCTPYDNYYTLQDILMIFGRHIYQLGQDSVRHTVMFIIIDLHYLIIAYICQIMNCVKAIAIDSRLSKAIALC